MSVLGVGIGYGVATLVAMFSGMPIAFALGAVATIPINRASGRHVGALAILDLFLDDIFPDSLGKPLFGPRQARPGGTFY